MSCQNALPIDPPSTAHGHLQDCVCLTPTHLLHPRAGSLDTLPTAERASSGRQLGNGKPACIYRPGRDDKL